MRNHTFTQWLSNEALAASYILLSAYEERDKMLHIDGPRLEKEYLEIFGEYEKAVIKAEIECELLTKKQLMIQTAINRHEPIDEAAIEKELDILRSQIYNEAKGEQLVAFANLTVEQLSELQEVYHEIIKRFHPQMNSDMTEAQCQLFEKAQSAYRLRDLNALVLIRNMLDESINEGIDLDICLQLVLGEDDDSKEKPNSDYLTDYTLASQIYKCFVQTDEEAAIQERRLQYKQATDVLISEIEELRTQFPYSAAQMLADSKRVEEYRGELSLRMRKANEEIERRTNDIKSIIERVKAHG